MATMSTGDVTKKLGFIINRKQIESFGVKPAEMNKAHPRWAVDDFPKICDGLIAMLQKIKTQPVEDDDEL